MTELTAMDDVLKRWRRDGVSLLPPHDVVSVITALDKTRRRYSSDVIALYCATGGMPDGEWDAHAWSLWPLKQVVLENANYERPHLLFADFLINSHLYCFRYESESDHLCAWIILMKKSRLFSWQRWGVLRVVSEESEGFGNV